MAPLPIIADVFRVAFNWVSSADPTLTAVNVMHFHAPGKTSSDVAAAIDAEVDFAMWQQTANTSKIASFNVTPLDGSSLTLPFVPSSFTNYTGSAGSGEVIPQVAAIVKLLTTHRGRSYRGRVFLPWVAEAALDYGNIATGNVTGLQAAWVDFLADMQAQSVNICVASYKLGTSLNVAAVIAESFAATVRRRQKRLSSN